MILYTNSTDLPVCKDAGATSIGQIVSCGYSDCGHVFYLVVPGTKELQQICPGCEEDIYLPLELKGHSAKKTV